MTARHLPAGLFVAGICLAALLLPTTAAAAGEPACSAPDAASLSTCTDCSPCESDQDCAGGSCVPVLQTGLICEEEDFCGIPPLVCSISCAPCSQSPCGAGEGSCIPVRQAFCTPEEVCAEKICEC